MMKKIFSVMLLCATVLMASCQKDDEVTIGVSEVKLDKAELSLVVDASGTLVATVLPDDAEDATVTWSSSDKTVATVSEAGAVLAIKVGETTITATAGGKTATCKVTVTAKAIAVTGVTLNKTTTAIEIEKTEKLVSTIAPANATDQSVTWSSDKETVATVAQDGTVTAVAAGETNITVTTKNGAKTATCKVTVTAKTIAVTGVTLNKTTTAIEIEKTEKLVSTIAPANATDQSVTWSSDKEAVATVAQDGTVTAVAAGEANITVTTKDGAKTATCKVTVPKKKSIMWAKGNLVADGANGAKVGTATDNGLYFQFGSLIGWSSEDPLALVVKPANYAGSTSWNEDWKGDPATDDAAVGKGDPCRYYLKGTWRMPTNDEFKKLFENHGYPNGPWTWNDSSKSATNSTLNLTFPASGCRQYDEDGSLISVGEIGRYYSMSLINEANANSLYFDNKGNTNLSAKTYRSQGASVRCVQEISE